jgi:hypothetical protein
VQDGRRQSDAQRESGHRRSREDGIAAKAARGDANILDG